MLSLLFFAFLGALGYAIIYTIIYDGGAWCDRFRPSGLRNKFLNHRRENDQLNRMWEENNRSLRGRIAKLLSGKYAEADEMLRDFAKMMRGRK
jgi:hypothetical protein